MKFGFKDLTGQRFSRWTVLSFSRSKIVGTQPRSFWFCRCECGAEKEIYTNSLTSGKSKSCGCLRFDLIARPIGQAARKNIYLTYRGKAARRNLSFELSEEDFSIITKKECSYCGKEPSNILHNKKFNGDYIYSGIDRRDNLLGYTKDNSFSCCKDCNMAKRLLSHVDFLALIKRIYERNFVYAKS